MSRSQNSGGPFEDHDALEASHVAERYVLGKLSAEEAERFEEHYLGCDVCLEKLELSRSLHQGLQEIATEEVQKAVGKAGFLAWFLRRSGAFQGAVAFGLLAAVVLPWAFLVPEVSRLRGEREGLVGELGSALAPQAQGLTYRLSPERSDPGGEPSTRLTLGEAPEWLSFALQLPPDRSAVAHRARLVGAEGETLWDGGPLEPDASGQVTVRVHSSWLGGTKYHLDLAALDGEGNNPSWVRFSFLVWRGGV